MKARLMAPSAVPLIALLFAAGSQAGSASEPAPDPNRAVAAVVYDVRVHVSHHRTRSTGRRTVLSLAWSEVRDGRVNGRISRQSTTCARRVVVKKFAVQGYQGTDNSVRVDVTGLPRGRYIVCLRVDPRSVQAPSSARGCVAFRF